jgi:hypothetical protein
MLLCLTGVLALFAALMLQSMKELQRGQWEAISRSQGLAHTHEEGGPEANP